MICFDDERGPTAGGGDAGGGGDRRWPHDAARCRSPAVGQMGGTCRGGVDVRDPARPAIQEDALGTMVGTDPLDARQHLSASPSGTEDPDAPRRVTSPERRLERCRSRRRRAASAPIACNPGSMADDGCGDVRDLQHHDRPARPSFPRGRHSRSASSFINDRSPATRTPASAAQDCIYDPATNGGCADGYTCDVVRERLRRGLHQRRASATSAGGVSRTDGLRRHRRSTAPRSPATPATGRCEWTAPADAAMNGSDVRGQTRTAPRTSGICLVGGTTARASTVQPRDGGRHDPGLPLPRHAHLTCVTFPGNGHHRDRRSASTELHHERSDCWENQSCRTDLLMGSGGRHLLVQRATAPPPTRTRSAAPVHGSAASASSSRPRPSAAASPADDPRGSDGRLRRGRGVSGRRLPVGARHELLLRGDRQPLLLEPRVQRRPGLLHR